MRQEYAAYMLDEKQAKPDALEQFTLWLDQAISAGLPEPNAMTLATLGLDGMPSARVVLLKELDSKGFVFYTNYLSNKAREIDNHPFAGLVFLWLELQRQVRIQGRIEKISPDESDAYFSIRPRESQIGAIASPQSKQVTGREELEERFRKTMENYQGVVPSRPDFWGGYRIIPTRLEFWQGRPSRMHDRILYTRKEDHWEIVRLAP